MRLLLLFLLLSGPALANPLVFAPDFEFGVANAPGQVEDALQDNWAEFARQNRIRSFDVPHAHDRLRFWSKPEDELEWVVKSGVQTYRLGIDWGRIMPARGQFDEKVLERYRELLKRIKAHKLKVMLTLMHHSIPRWLQESGGWTNDLAVPDFLAFAQRVMPYFSQDVDYWVSFNEPTIFAVMTYVAGNWPGGQVEASPLGLVHVGPLKGQAVKALDRMARAHNQLFDWAHAKLPGVKLGLAHNMALYEGDSWLDKLQAWYVNDLLNWYVPDAVEGHTDFYGINYYGSEWIKHAGLWINPSEEYSEAGRAINPTGLYLLLKEIQGRYHSRSVFITENGIADTVDWLRPAYIVEHLAAVAKARTEGVPVNSYILWTLTDNLEWADGYCPKFGLLGVDREHDLKRVPRPSFALFEKIARSHQVSDVDRELAWQLVRSHVGQDRPYCRAADGVRPLDVAVPRKVIAKDWRFRL